MNTEDSLVIFERAAIMLAEADTVQKCKAGKDLCFTAERYAKARRLSAESIQHARSYALEFERKLGEMLKEKPNPSREHGGHPGRKDGGESASPPSPTLEELGITKDESKTAQAVANLSDKDFQAVKAGTISKKAAIKQNRAANRPYRQKEIVAFHDNGSNSQTGSITPDMLSMSAQRRLELAIKQHMQKLGAEYRQAVEAKTQELEARTQELLVSTIGPRLRKEQDEARWVMKSRKGIMDRKTYRKILSCLHPDRVSDLALKQFYEEAFRSFTVMEKLLLDEKNSPTEFVNIPRKAAEWDALKRQANVARKAKQTAGIQTKN